MKGKWYNNPIVLIIGLVLTTWWLAVLIWPVVGVVYFFFPRRWPILRIILQAVIVLQVVSLIRFL